MHTSARGAHSYTERANHPDARVGTLSHAPPPPNPAGKSTLLKLILGELEPSAGHVARNPKLRVACFTQHHTAQLDMTATPLDYLGRLYPGQKPETLRAHLSAFGLSGDLALQPIRTLSGAFGDGNGRGTMGSGWGGAAVEAALAPHCRRVHPPPP